MPYVKYTRAVLAEAVAASTTMAGVLRHLGIPLNGGTHAHLRRRKIAAALGRRAPVSIVVSGSTVAAILRKEGLSTQQDRIDAAKSMV